jgi:hypothetical protein
MIYYPIIRHESVQRSFDDCHSVSSHQHRLMDARMLPNPLAEFAALEAHLQEDQWTAELGIHTPLFVYAK